MKKMWMRKKKNREFTPFRHPSLVLHLQTCPFCLRFQSHYKMGPQGCTLHYCIFRLRDWPFNFQWHMLPQMNHVAKDNNSQLKLDFVCCKIFHLRMATRLGNYLLDHVKKMTTIACFIYQPKLHQIVCLFLLINHVLMSFFFKKKTNPGSTDRDTTAIPTSRKLQFLVVTQSTPAFFISFCITANLFLSLSNAKILLQEKGKKSISQSDCLTDWLIDRQTDKLNF